jgi:hypothetical protein
LIEEKEDYEGNKLIELLFGGTGIREGILRTIEIHVLKYKEAMIGAKESTGRMSLMKNMNK